VDVQGNTARPTFLELPIYLKVSMPLRGVTPFAFAGPQAAVELGCTGPCRPDQKTLSYAAVAGAGVKVGPRGRFSLRARYLLGVTDAVSSSIFPPGGFSIGGTYKLRTLSLMAGVTF
jgi:hypothetical protein